MAQSSNRKNTPVDQLTDTQLVDTIVGLGIFANVLRTNDQACKKFTLKRLLICCLKLYDMNLLHLSKKNDQYFVQSTQLPLSIVNHLVATDSDKSFLSDKVVSVVDRFISVAKAEKLFEQLPASEIPKKPTKKPKNDRNNPT